jgi:hypothetical protein
MCDPHLIYETYSCQHLVVNNIDVYVPYDGSIYELTIKDSPNLNKLNFTNRTDAELIDIARNGPVTSLPLPDQGVYGNIDSKCYQC